MAHAAEEGYGDQETSLRLQPTLRTQTIPLSEEWTQMKRMRRYVQSALQHKAPLALRNALPDSLSSVENERLSGARGQLVQHALNLLLDPTLALPAEADELRDRIEALDPQLGALMQIAGFERFDQVLYWIEQRYPNSMATAVDTMDTHARPLLVTRVNHGELAVVYTRLFQELPPLLTNTPSSSFSHLDVEALLAVKSVRESQAESWQHRAFTVLTKPSVGDLKMKAEVQSKDGPAVREFCHYLLRDRCHDGKACPKLHFNVLTNANTDAGSGDCPYLDTCRNPDRCRFLHYELEPGSLPPNMPMLRSATSPAPPDAEWICCDIRRLDFGLIGKFGVILADPPWDIHMELPYGTMTDEEMLKLPVLQLQDSGYLFLWVTGRAMELGRECMVAWGYERVEEIVWVKTNQVQRMLRAGRTGHWLNHSKEHCLIGVKGAVKSQFAGVDCDVLVAPLRETSRKPEELYSLIERLAPQTRRIELFGRPHNMRNGWTTVGNQLDGVRLKDPLMQQRVEAFLDKQREEQQQQQQQQATQSTQ